MDFHCFRNFLDCNLQNLKLSNFDNSENHLRTYHTYLYSCTVKRYHVPYNNTPKQLEYARKVMDQFRSYNQMLLSMVQPYITSSLEIDNKVKGKLLENIPKKYKDFFGDLLGNQLFSVYLTEYIVSLCEEEEV